MAKIIVVAGSKGGSGKSTIAGGLAHGLALLGVAAYHVSTDQGREVPNTETRRYACLDGRDPKKLAGILDRLRAMPGAVGIIDGGGSRPAFDAVLAKVADATLVPFMSSEQDLRVARADLERLPGSVGLPNRWPTQKWAREVADRALAAELGAYKDRLMGRMPEINALGTLLRDEGPSPKISNACRNLALRIFDRLHFQVYDFQTPERKSA